MSPSEIPTRYLGHHYNSRIYRGAQKYVVNRYGASFFKEICRTLSVPFDSFTSDVWFSNDFACDFLEVLKEKSGDPLVAEKVGRITASPEVLSTVEYTFMASFLSPYLFFRFLPRHYSRFNRFNKVVLACCRPGYCELNIAPHQSGKVAHPDVCISTKGTLYSVKYLFGLDSIEVQHPICLHQGADTCTFTIKYSAIKMWKSRLKNVLLFCSATFALFSFLKEFLNPANQNYIFILSSLLFGLSVTLIRKHYKALNYVCEYYEQSHEGTSALNQDRINIQEEKSRILLAKQVSHDIRSPLAALKIASDLPSSTEQKKLLQQVIKRIQDIANSLLDSEKIKDEIVDPKKLIEEIVTEKKLELQADNIQGAKIAFDVFTTNCGNIRADLSKTQRSLSNIINNSIEAITDTGVIRIRTEKTNDFLIISVSDNGVGIPQEVISRLGIVTKSYKTKGHGLGLYQAKAYLDAIGGKLQIESKVNEGTAVSLFFPI